MKKVLLVGLGVLVLTPRFAGGQTLSIDHQAVGCAVAEKFPRLEARFAPTETVAVARVVFQTENTQQWYAVAMKAEGPAFSGVLPKPKKSLKAFKYYIEVTDKALGTNRTADYTTNVVGSSAECKGKLMAGVLGSASVLLQVPAGAAALPAGFASTGVVAAGSAAAATGAAGGGGGGLGTGAIVGIVAGAGAVAAGVVVVASKDGGSSSNVELHGQVYATGTASNPVNRVAGASVSTSLDGTTAPTDGNGQFHLVTQTPKAADDCRLFTITIVAVGNPTYSVAAKWGNGWGDSGGQNLAHTFILSPAYPSATSIIKPQCP